MRTIFHIDVNSAFLSWEAAHRLKCGDSLDIRTVPSVVGGDEKSRRGIVLAKSIPAKAFGIKTGEPLAQARKKCPNLLVIPSNYPLYQEYSHMLRQFLYRFSPSIEPFSIDECFLEYTGMERLFSSPLHTAELIKDGIEKELGFTVNIGISENKILAKMASDFEKPNRIHTLYREEIPEKMWSLPVSDLFMVGRRTAPTLQKMGIQTIGDLAHTDPNLLCYHLKSQGFLLWNYANGVDSSVIAPLPPPKSVGNSITIPEDADTMEKACEVLLKLSESVGMRLRKLNMRTSFLGIVIRTNDFLNFGHQKHLSDATARTNHIYDASKKLLRELWDGRPLRLLGIQASHLSPENDGQQRMWDTEEEHRLDDAIDCIRDKFGEDILLRGRILHSPLSIRSSEPVARFHK